MREALRTHQKSNVWDRAVRSTARKLDPPYVVKRYIGEQFVRLPAIGRREFSGELCRHF
jgi:hypothetical protein